MAPDCYGNSNRPSVGPRLGIFNEEGEGLKSTIAVVFIVVVLAVGAIVAISTISAIRPATGSATTNSSVGLEFTMALNASTVQQGHDLGVLVNLINALDRTNNVTGAKEWRVTNQSESGPSMNCAQNDPFRVEVLRGHYDLNNYSEVTPIVFTVFQPPLGFNQCLVYIRAANSTAEPLFFIYSQNYYIFKPLSNEAQWVAFGFQTVNQKAVMSETILLRPALFLNSTGVFTVVGGDEWGDLEVAHFSVA
jgi:hypothetical protein